MARRVIRVLAILLLAGLSVYSSLQYWLTTQKYADPRLILDDPVSKWEKRVSAIELPAQAGNEIGYVADWDVNSASDPIGQDEEYVLTQYTLAPRILRRGGGYEWVVGNLTLPGVNDWLSQNYKDSVIHYYGFGIYLIHRPSP